MCAGENINFNIVFTLEEEEKEGKWHPGGAHKGILTMSIMYCCFKISET